MVEPAGGVGAAGGRMAVVKGDWDDVYAAALVSAERIEGAIMGRESPREGVLVVRFLTIRDREGTLTAERLEPAKEGGGPEPIRLTARIGAFGDPENEERLVRAVGARLRELTGREWAPVGK